MIGKIQRMKGVRVVWFTLVRILKIIYKKQMKNMAMNKTDRFELNTKWTNCRFSIFFCSFKFSKK